MGNPAEKIEPGECPIIYSVHCPVHKHIEIGEWAGRLEDIVHQGFYCGKCGKIKKFNRESFRKSLQLGLFPVKV